MNQKDAVLIFALRILNGSTTVLIFAPIPNTQPLH
jgi:hypothetical protein